MGPKHKMRNLFSGERKPANSVGSYERATRHCRWGQWSRWGKSATYHFLSLFLGVSSCLAVPAQHPQDSNGKPAADQTGGGNTGSSPTAPAASSNAEVATHDAPTTFKVRVNVVLVRVVVRDENGKIVSNLKKEDFQLFDNRKPQVISSFGVETPETAAIKTTTARKASGEEAIATDSGITPRPVTNLPQRFVAMVFDDVHLAMSDATFVRDAATRFFNAMAPTDRVGIYTTSGQVAQEFTDSHEALQKTLLQIVPRPRATNSSFHDCPDIDYYEAYLIQDQHDSQALAVATEDAVQCAYNGDERQQMAAGQLAQTAAMRMVSDGDADTLYAYRHLDDIARRLAVMPGQRVMVLVSPGFLQTQETLEASELIDRATHGNIVINTIDARGLYVPDLGGDIASPAHDSARTAGLKSMYRTTGQSMQADVLGELADGTGGTFFHNRNDIDEGMREAGVAPAISYLLGFSPQNLKLNGSYHTLKVTLTNRKKLALQARRGYYAPKTTQDPSEAAKEEIQEAIFSQDEMHDLPMDLQTQFFKQDASQAKLSVVTRFDVKGIHFRKAEGRNLDSLTIATAIFDENGNLVTGGEKILEMKLLDATYDQLSRTGLTVKSSFDVKPGTYMVRLVVRDAEGTEMAARNGAVVIPN